MMLTEAINVLRTVSKVINNVDSTTGQQKGRNYVEYALVLVIGIGIGMTVHKLSVANNGTKSAPTTTVIHNYIEIFTIMYFNLKKRSLSYVIPWVSLSNKLHGCVE
jgi:hypothetical protein